MALASTPHTKHATHLHIQQADTTEEAKWDMFDDHQASSMSTKNVLELGQGDKRWHSPYILVYEKQARKCGADHEPPQAVSTPTSAVARRKSDNGLEAFVDKCKDQELFFSRHTNTVNTMVSGEVLCSGVVLSAIANTHESRPYVYGVALESSSKDSKNVRQNTQPHPRPQSKPTNHTIRSTQHPAPCICFFNGSP